LKIITINTWFIDEEIIKTAARQGNCLTGLQHFEWKKIIHDDSLTG
jgi:hypothetical protein